MCIRRKRLSLPFVFFILIVKHYRTWRAPIAILQPYQFACSVGKRNRTYEPKCAVTSVATQTPTHSKGLHKIAIESVTDAGVTTPVSQARVTTRVHQASVNTQVPQAHVATQVHQASVTTQVPRARWPLEFLKQAWPHKLPHHASATYLSFKLWVR